MLSYLKIIESHQWRPLSANGEFFGDDVNITQEGIKNIIIIICNISIIIFLV